MEFNAYLDEDEGFYNFSQREEADWNNWKNGKPSESWLWQFCTDTEFCDCGAAMISAFIGTDQINRSVVYTPKNWFVCETW